MARGGGGVCVSQGGLAGGGSGAGGCKLATDLQSIQESGRTARRGFMSK